MPKHVIYDNVIYYDDGEVDKEKETKKQEKNTQKHVIYHDDVEDYVEGAIADISGFDLEAYKASLPEGVHMWVDHHPTTIDNGFAPLPLFKDIMKQKKPMTYIEEHQIDLDKLLPRLSSRWPSTKDEEYRRRGEKVNSASDLHKLLSPLVIQDAPIQSCRSKLGVGPTIYPQRSGQLECDIYMKTGQCKFGKRCKFHHPIDRTAPSSGDEYSELYYRTYGRRGRTPAATCTGGDREITPTGWEDGEDNDVDVWCAPAYEDVGSSSGAREITPTGWEDDDDDDVDVRRTSVYGDVGSSSGAREITPTGWEDDDVDVWRVPAYGDVGDDGNGGFVDSIFGYPPQHGYGSRPYGYGRNYET